MLLANLIVLNRRGPRWVADQIMRQVAYACRYGKAGLCDALGMDRETLWDFCSAVNQIVLEEKGKA